MPKTPLTRHRVLFVVFDQFQLLDLAGPMQVFATACDQLNAKNPNTRRDYARAVVSLEGGMIDTPAGARIETTKFPARIPPHTTLLVVGGPGIDTAQAEPRIVRWLERAAPKAARVGSICNGAFLLARAGLLSGRRAATHWMDCADLQRRYPDIDVDRDSIYVRDGNVWTSAGASAGIDLALALVAEDHSPGVATLVARRLVLYAKRPGNQSQFSDFIALAMRDSDSAFAELNDWILEHIDRELSVPILAHRANMSERTFARRYSEVMGVPPAEAVTRFRADAARLHLRGSNAPFKQVARSCGFSSVEHMNRVHKKIYGITSRVIRETA